MKKSWSGQRNHLNAFIKTAQYLASLTTQQDIWREVGKILVSFFGVDLAAVGERRTDGEIVDHHWTFSDQVTSKMNLGSESKKGIAEVLESGFITSRRISSAS